MPLFKKRYMLLMLSLKGLKKKYIFKLLLTLISTKKSK